MWPFALFLDPRTFRTPQCCQAPSSPFEHVHHNCFPIEIPATDPFYGPESQGHGHGQSCMSFARSLAGLRPDCRLGECHLYFTRSFVKHETKISYSSLVLYSQGRGKRT